MLPAVDSTISQVGDKNKFAPDLYAYVLISAQGRYCFLCEEAYPRIISLILIRNTADDIWIEAQEDVPILS